MEGLGCCTMYALEKMQDYSDDITLPSCMYFVKNIHASKENTSVNNDEQPSKNIKALAQRQERILRQLEELKLQLQSIRKNNQLTASITIPNYASNSTKDNLLPELEGQMQEIVVCAHPQRPPLSLMVLLNMLRGQLKIGTKCHVHSSITDMPSALLELFKSESNLSRKSYQLMVTIIWKNVDGLEAMMIIDPTLQSPIRGEANIARYVSKLLMGKNEDLIYVTEVDTLLDLIHGSVMHGNNKEIQSVLRLLNGRLGKTRWIMGDNEPSIVDIVTWSALRQTQSIDTALANVSKWLKNCLNHEFFRQVNDNLCALNL